VRQSSRITGVWSNITDETINAADDDVIEMSEMALPGRGSGKDEESEKTTDEEWKASDHPRAENGEFTSGGGGEVGEHPLGPLYHEFAGKPKEAIAKLIAEKKGAVPNVPGQPGSSARRRLNQTRGAENTCSRNWHLPYRIEEAVGLQCEDLCASPEREKHSRVRNGPAIRRDIRE
jgi:hypothetical protein